MILPVFFEELDLNEDALLKLWEENYFENDDENLINIWLKLKHQLEQRDFISLMLVLLDGLFVVSPNKGDMKNCLMT